MWLLIVAFLSTMTLLTLDAAGIITVSWLVITAPMLVWLLLVVLAMAVLGLASGAVDIHKRKE
jgi:hypothetical protein